MSDSKRKQAFINLDLFPTNLAMIVETESGDEYEITKDERGLWYAYSDIFAESFTFESNPIIPTLGSGQGAKLGPITTDPVAYVVFAPANFGDSEDDDDDFTPEPPDDDLPPTGGAALVIEIGMDTPVYPSLAMLLAAASLKTGSRLGVVA